MNNKKFTIEPETIEPLLALWFEYIHGQELDDKEVYWQRDKIIMTKEFESAVKSDLNLDLSHEFALFYAGKMEDVPFFERIEERLNQAGFYTYNSDTRFEVYSADDIDLSEPEIQACLELDEPRNGQLLITLKGVTDFQIEQIKLNLLAHIQEEIKCNVYPKSLSFDIYNNDKKGQSSV